MCSFGLLVKDARSNAVSYVVNRSTRLKKGRRNDGITSNLLKRKREILMKLDKACLKNKSICAASMTAFERVSFV